MSSSHRSCFSSVDEFELVHNFRPKSIVVAGTAGKPVYRVRVSSVNDLYGFHVSSKEHLVHYSKQDFWKLGTDDEGYFIERLVDDSDSPVKA